MSDQTDLLQGTLDLLIMRTIAPEPLHEVGLFVDAHETLAQQRRQVFEVRPVLAHPLRLSTGHAPT